MSKAKNFDLGQKLAAKSIDDLAHTLSCLGLSVDEVSYLLMSQTKRVVEGEGGDYGKMYHYSLMSDSALELLEVSSEE